MTILENNKKIKNIPIKNGRSPNNKMLSLIFYGF